MHIMLDLETLDTAPTAIVLSIGAVAFDANKVYADESRNVSSPPRS